MVIYVCRYVFINLLCACMLRGLIFYYFVDIISTAHFVPSFANISMRSNMIFYRNVQDSVQEYRYKVNGTPTIERFIHLLYRHR